MKPACGRCHARFIGGFYAAPGFEFPRARMYPRKTDLAWQALQSHAAPLGMRERQALILCDGHRGLTELGALLGPGTAAQIERLCAAGYLVMTGTPTASTNAQTAEAVRPAPNTAAPAPPTPVIPTPVIPVPVIPVPVTPVPVTAARRSIVAAKLYMVGMLELQRHESAASHRTRLQACQDPDATAAHILAAVHCLQRTTSTSFTQRVRERLAEVMPEPYLPALERLDLALASAASQ